MDFPLDELTSLLAPASAAAQTWLLCLLISASALVFSLVFDEYSFVDRVWCLEPLWYSLIIWYHAAPNPRLNLVLGLIFLWSLRLTYHTWRRGYYRFAVGEDYRWAYIRDRFGEFWFQVLNVVFISTYQNILLWFITAPVLVIAAYSSPLTPTDYGLAAAFLLFLLVETINDEHQQAFQKAKRSPAASHEHRLGFCYTGMFQYSRHPSFVGEQGMWVVVWLFSLQIGWTWTWIGPAMLLSLFQGSTWMTELISVQRYGDAYEEYQRRTWRLLPLGPCRSMDSYQKRKE